MSYRLAFDLHDEETDTRHPLILSGGLWHGDVFLYDFSINLLGMSGRIECDWRQQGPRFTLDQGDGSTPRAQAALRSVAMLLRPFFSGAFCGVSDDALAALYPGDYHVKSGYADNEPNPIEAQFKGAVADMVCETLKPRKVLDAGCAAGLLVREFQRRGVEAHGFDLCPDLDRIAIADVREHLRRGTVTNIPYGPEDGFDTFVCIDVFEHVPEDRVPQMVREIDRLGVKYLALHIVHSEIEHLGHITLRPLTWWDRQLGPTFRRAQTTGGALLALPHPLDPRRVLRIYQRVVEPTVVLPTAGNAPGAAQAAASAGGSQAPVA